MGHWGRKQEGKAGFINLFECVIERRTLCFTLLWTLLMDFGYASYMPMFIVAKNIFGEAVLYGRDARSSI